jgi:general secretion pathway protein K
MTLPMNGPATPPTEAAGSRGVALITALILLALLTSIAVALSRDTGLSIRRQIGASAQGQAWQLLGAAESLASWALRDELTDSSARVHYGQRWSQPLGPVEPVPGFLLETQLEDLGGRFNLNSLIDSSGTVDPIALEFFERLLQRLELEPDWAARLADWMDADDRPLPGGGEEAYHSSATPAARPANQLLVSASEILSLPDFGAERYLRLEPHVAALPRDASLNLCTASAAVLDTLTGDQQWTLQPEMLQRSQREQCFPGKEAVRNATRDRQRFADLERKLGLGETSTYFGLQSWVQIGSVEYALYSVLQLERGQGGVPQVRILTRENNL